MFDNYTVVIPMAGLGSRFVEAGWTDPKPFIPFFGKMMVEHVLDSFKDAEQEYNIQFVLIFREDFIRNYSNQVRKLVGRGNVRYVSTEKLTQGAACTVLLAREFFRNSKLIVADSDTFYEASVVTEFLRHIKETKSSQSVITFAADEPCFSYINILENEVEIAEKKVISNHALSGVYYFNKGEDFEKEAINAMIYGDKDKGEYYMSKILNRLAKGKQKVTFFEISKERMFCAGTPRQLEEVVKRL